MRLFLNHRFVRQSQLIDYFRGLFPSFFERTQPFLISKLTQEASHIFAAKTALQFFSRKSHLRKEFTWIHILSALKWAFTHLVLGCLCHFFSSSHYKSIRFHTNLWLSPDHYHWNSDLFYMTLKTGSADNVLEVSLSQNLPQCCWYFSWNLSFLIFFRDCYSLVQMEDRSVAGLCSWDKSQVASKFLFIKLVGCCRAAISHFSIGFWQQKDKIIYSPWGVTPKLLFSCRSYTNPDYCFLPSKCYEGIQSIDHHHPTNS